MVPTTPDVSKRFYSSLTSLKEHSVKNNIF